jgi:hypothetical protein
MTKDELIPKLDQLIQSSDQFVSEDRFVDRLLISECQFWFSEVITWINRSVGSDSFYYKEAVRIQANSKRQGGIYIDDVQMMIGHIRQFRSALYDDLLSDVHAAYLHLTSMISSNTRRNTAGLTEKLNPPSLRRPY